MAGPSYKRLGGLDVKLRGLVYITLVLMFMEIPMSMFLLVGRLLIALDSRILTNQILNVAFVRLFGLILLIDGSNAVSVCFGMFVPGLKNSRDFSCLRRCFD